MSRPLEDYSAVFFNYYEDFWSDHVSRRILV